MTIFFLTVLLCSMVFACGYVFYDIESFYDWSRYSMRWMWVIALMSGATIALLVAALLRELGVIDVVM